ncbi:ATP-binding protein [Andreprevotia chitinilytica]|uniref:ATP-binding protein n=1 Tax=Andreprevotia chitinilytica TaxID=396808 RepID=UPI00068FA98B|nr:ATP-binding protein [Andreprevotia chitinilytica]
MPRMFRRWTPEFADTETERVYRDASLPDLTRTARIALWLGSTAGQVFVINDFRLLGFGALLVALVGVRLLVAAYGFALLFATRGGRQLPTLTGHMFVWTIGLWIINNLAAASRPAGFMASGVVLLTLVFAGFLFIPMRYGQRVFCGAVGMASNVLILLALGRLAAADVLPLVLVFTVALLVGCATAFLLERQRRVEFSCLQAVAAANQRLAAEISERERLAAVLEESERNLARLFEIAPIPLSLSDSASGRIVRVNPAWRDLLRVPTAELDQLNATDFYADPAERERLLALLQRDGLVDGMELRCCVHDGADLWLAVSARSITWHGRPSLLACSYDLSARKEEERALRLAKQVAEGANEAKSRFLAVISHELRTPMNGVLGLLQLLETSQLDATQRGHIETAQTSAETLIALLDQILDYVQLEGEAAPHEPVVFELHSLLASTVDLLRPRAEAKGLTLALDVAGPCPLALRGDANRLRQVLYNLISNATKFTDSGAVTVSVAALPLQDERVEVQIAVRDTGIGIAPGMQERIFEEFIQADASIARRFGGTGLGLAICRKIVRRMGGEIGVESAPSRGSTFRCRISFERGVEAQAHAMQPVAAWRSLKVLVVEDEPINRVVIAGLLSQLGHEAIVVEGAVQAINQAANTAFDAVLMDLHLPGMDGIEAVRGIRALGHPQRAAVPIVALTADVTLESQRRCEAAGIRVVVAKPILRSALAAALGSVGGSGMDVVASEPAATDLSLNGIDAKEGSDLLDHAYLAQQAEALGAMRLLPLIRLFHQTSRQTLAELSAAALADDRRTVSELAHRLRTACGALGLARLHGLATVIEKAAGSKTTDLVTAVAELGSIRTASLRALIAAVRVAMVQRERFEQTSAVT